MEGQCKFSGQSTVKANISIIPEMIHIRQKNRHKVNVLNERSLKYFFKVSADNTRKTCVICSIKTVSAKRNMSDNNTTIINIMSYVWDFALRFPAKLSFSHGAALTCPTDENMTFYILEHDCDLLTGVAISLRFPTIKLAMA